MLLCIFYTEKIYCLLIISNFSNSFRIWHSWSHQISSYHKQEQFSCNWRHPRWIAVQEAFWKWWVFKGVSDEKKKTEIHISFQINTDGVALFSSSKYSIWPVYLVNELPLNCRYTYGIWYDICSYILQNIYLVLWLTFIVNIRQEGLVTKKVTGENNGRD